MNFEINIVVVVVVVVVAGGLHILLADPFVYTSGICRTILISSPAFTE